MYQTLWNFIKKHTKKTHSAFLFLFTLISSWSIIGLLFGALLCMSQSGSLPVQLTILLCTTGYAGLIPGFFGGIFFLYRLNLKRPAFQNLSDSEQKIVEAAH